MANTYKKIKVIYVDTVQILDFCHTTEKSGAYATSLIKTQKNDNNDMSNKNHNSDFKKAVSSGQ